MRKNESPRYFTRAATFILAAAFLALLSLPVPTLAQYWWEEPPEWEPPPPANTQCGGFIRTDLNNHAEPPTPALPPSGGKICDNVFGTTVMRVTDEVNAPNGGGTAYSYWPTFNKNSTKIFAIVGNQTANALIFDFDPDTFTLGASSEPARIPGGWYFHPEISIWSGVDPEVLYGVESVSSKLWAYNVRTRVYTLVKDFAADGHFPANHYLWQMSRSLDDDVFAFTERMVVGDQYPTVGYIIYRRSTGQVIRRQTAVGADPGIDEVQLDKTGRYLVFKTGHQGAGLIEVEIIDLLKNTRQRLTDDAPDYAPGHSDNGYGIVVGADNWVNRLNRRNLGDRQEFIPLWTFGWGGWGGDHFHVTMTADDDTWALLGMYVSLADGQSPGLFRRELVQFATDGSGRVRRLAHHHSRGNDYYNSPRPNVSRDGRFVAFSSNWGGRSRNDLFVVQIPQAPQGTAVQFSAASYPVAENDSRAGVDLTVTRTGDLSGTTRVEYETVPDHRADVRCDDNTTTPGTAYSRCDFATSVDTLTFAPGESQKTFRVPLVNDAHVEAAEAFRVALDNPRGAVIGPQHRATVHITDDDFAAGPNPIYDNGFFVRMHYIDFLSREPDPGGYNSWVSLLANCQPGDTSCDRVAVSQSFFMSEEFRLKGYYVYLFYKVSLGRLPRYYEMIPDMRRVTGATAEEVFQKKTAFADAWMRQPDFYERYNSITDPAAYVDTLLATTGVTLTSEPTRNTLVAELQSGAKTRAQVLRAIVEHPVVQSREYNGAFVAMQYFGYLRRDPEPDGYNAWLNFLNQNPNSTRIMVDGFVNSYEYRLRFGQP